jgi:hypothetical protein
VDEGGQSHCVGSGLKKWKGELFFLDRKRRSLEDRRVRQEVRNIIQDESVDILGDKGFQDDREILDVTCLDYGLDDGLKYCVLSNNNGTNRYIE